MIDQDAWIKRADEVIASTSPWDSSAALQFATSMITAFYGPDSPQMKTFRSATEGIQKARGVHSDEMIMHARATVQNIKAEIQTGLAQGVRALIAGEIVSELLAVAKDILSDNSESAKNVGAVLVAAAFEDTVRRMGSEFAGVLGRPALQEVIITLKDKDVLKGGEPGTAQSYLKFRNDSLHADWANVQRTQVESCLAFVEALLVKHFS